MAAVTGGAGPSGTAPLDVDWSLVHVYSVGNTDVTSALPLPLRPAPPQPPGGPALSVSTDLLVSTPGVVQAVVDLLADVNMSHLCVHTRCAACVCVA